MEGDVPGVLAVAFLLGVQDGFVDRDGVGDGPVTQRRGGTRAARRLLGVEVQAGGGVPPPPATPVSVVAGCSTHHCGRSGACRVRPQSSAPTLTRPVRKESFTRSEGFRKRCAVVVAGGSGQRQRAWPRRPADGRDRSQRGAGDAPPQRPDPPVPAAGHGLDSSTDAAGRAWSRQARPTGVAAGNDLEGSRQRQARPAPEPEGTPTRPLTRAKARPRRD